MNIVWQKMLRQSRERIYEKKRRRERIIGIYCKIAAVFFCLYLIFPQYFRRAVYPYLFGKPTTEKLQISAADSYSDVSARPFYFTRGKITYTLVPQTKYAVTARVGIVEDYDTLFNRIYRGQFQGAYINMVPRDVLLVIGNMAKPSVFAKFDFGHEERLGVVACKNVKYKTSFMPSFMSEEQAAENMKNFQQCNQYIKTEEYNNYHPIPANERINKALSMLVKGDVVHLEGLLVDVPQMKMTTGTRKEQTHRNIMIGGQAPGMCFILYTTKVILNNRVYE